MTNKEQLLAEDVFEVTSIYFEYIRKEREFIENKNSLASPFDELREEILTICEDFERKGDYIGEDSWYDSLFDFASGRLQDFVRKQNADALREGGYAWDVGCINKHSDDLRKYKEGQVYDDYNDTHLLFASLEDAVEFCKEKYFVIGEDACISNVYIDDDGYVRTNRFIDNYYDLMREAGW